MLDGFDAQGEVHQRSYSVEAIRVVKSQDVGHLTVTREDSLTLITCYPFGRTRRSPQRFIVRALPLEPETFEAASQSRTAKPSGPGTR
jgi:LPXTG-site transpeptidase (sortase) family protein